MKMMSYLLCAVICAFSFVACAKKPSNPVGNFQSVECRTTCNAKECFQQCVGASGDFYRK